MNQLEQYGHSKLRATIKHITKKRHGWIQLSIPITNDWNGEY